MARKITYVLTVGGLLAYLIISAAVAAYDSQKFNHCIAAGAVDVYTDMDAVHLENHCRSKTP